MKKTVITILAIVMVILIIVLIAIFSRGKVYVEPTVMDNPDLPSIELNGIKFHAESFGDENETTIIVLHGGPGGDYRNLMELSQLSDEYRVVFFDQRGSGLSQRVEKKDISMDHFIADVDAFVDHYGNGKAIIIGHSWGATLGIDYTAQYPDKVIQLVVAEPGFLTPEMFEEYKERTNGMQPELTKEVRQHLIKSFLDSLRSNRPDKQAGRDHFINEFYTGLYIEDHPLGGYYIDGDIRNADSRYWRFGSLVSTYLPTTAMNKKEFTYSFAEGIEKYESEVLMLTSDSNTIIGLGYQEKHMDLFINARMEVIENAGHTMFNDNLEDCLYYIREYLQ